MAKLLVLNLGSTSTKVALFEGERMVLSQTLRHSADELKPFSTPLQQRAFRQTHVEAWMKDESIAFSDLDMIVARGGMLRPLPGGVYRINAEVAEDAASERFGAHVSNVGLLIAHSWSKTHHLDAVFVDGPSTDDLEPIARITGVKELPRRSAFHALNQKQCAKRYAQTQGCQPHELNLIVAHMGGGISIGAHGQGRVIDVTNGLDGEGPFSPERSGELPNLNVLNALEKYDVTTLRQMLVGKSGLISHFNTSDVQSLVTRAHDEPEVDLVLDAMTYQIAKHIGAMATVLKGKVDQILLTGGLAYSDFLMQRIEARVRWIAPITRYPGEDELLALALGALSALKGELEILNYE